MFGKKVTWLILGVMLMSGVCNATGVLVFEDEKATESFIQRTNSGENISCDEIRKIDQVTEMSMLTRSNIVKNLFVASRSISSTMADIHLALLQKQLEIASCTEMPLLDEKSPHSKISDNLKIIVLLMNSQLDSAIISSDPLPKLLASAKLEIIEAVINRLSDAVNGDKAVADVLLSKFYETLKGSPFEGYLPLG